MSGNVQALVESTVGGLGYELVDFEHSARGLLRIFIDKPDGISVEDCASVSNHLSRVFLVEGVDFERLEVSSPGLDRSLRTLKDFQRFVGCGAKVKLNAMIDGRRKFDGVIEAAGAESVNFRLIEDAAKPGVLKSNLQKGVRKTRAASTTEAGAGQARFIDVPLEKIDRARLIPDI